MCFGFFCNLCISFVILTSYVSFLFNDAPFVPAVLGVTGVLPPIPAVPTVPFASTAPVPVAPPVPVAVLVPGSR